MKMKDADGIQTMAADTRISPAQAQPTRRKKKEKQEESRRLGSRVDLQRGWSRRHLGCPPR